MDKEKLNEHANHHLLSENETKFFKGLIEIMQDKIGVILDECELEGNWSLSDDLKYLVKVGD